ncbi:MAG TPA: PH domain-containing protein [Frankiaceae bacterium]|jgi:hypothetical protein|nr:PH domain-containing protein [Frankiaceae bacterium]
MSGDRTVLRPFLGRLNLALAVGWVLVGVTSSRWWGWPFAVVGAAYYGAAGLATTTLTPGALVVRTWRGRRRVAWEDVRDVVAARRNGAVARLRDGSRLALPGVTMRPEVPEAYADAASAQGVLAYARRHGAPPSEGHPGGPERPSPAERADQAK